MISKSLSNFFSIQTLQIKRKSQKKPFKCIKRILKCFIHSKAEANDHRSLQLASVTVTVFFPFELSQQRKIRAKTWTIAIICFIFTVNVREKKLSIHILYT